jgi:hypothetical protein
MVPDLPAEELAEIREDQGIEPWEEGDFVMMPDNVECIHCGACAETMHFKDA